MLKAEHRVFCGVVALSGLLALPFAVIVHRIQPDDAAFVRWGGADPTLSEMEYYEHQITTLIDAWHALGQRAEHDEEGRFLQPHHIYLVIDAAERAVWIEDSGQVLAPYVADLPVQMAWTVYCDSGSELISHDQVTRLRHRGAHADRHRAELIWLVGRDRDGGHTSLGFNSHFRGKIKAYAGPFHRHYAPSPRQKGIDYYASIIACQAEYEKSRRLWTQARDVWTSERRAPRPGLDENRAAWLRVEKKLYQAIEGQVLRAGGFDPRALTVKPGPDYRAAYAEMVMDMTGFSSWCSRWWGSGSQTAYLYLKIDSLGDSIWYVRSARDPRVYWVTSCPKPPELEFLVSAGDLVGRRDRAAWIRKGRQMPGVPPPPQSRWRAELPDRAAVELIGICASLVSDKQWWSPTGGPIEYVPSFNNDWYVHVPADQKVLEFMWRVYRPPDTRTLSVRSSCAGNPPLGQRQPCDRHGTELLDVYCHSHAVEKSQEKSTLTLAIDVDEQGMQQVRFTGVSLVPGKDFGLAIEALR